MIYQDVPAVKIPYIAEDGSEVAVRFRIALDGDDRFRWRKGSPKYFPYGLNRFGEARRARYVVIVGGETDCHTLWLHGFPSLGLPSADSWSEDRGAPLLAGLAAVFIVMGPHNRGGAVMEWLHRSSIAPRVRLIRLVTAEDPSALYLADPAGFPAALQHALDAAEPWQMFAEREAAVDAERATQTAGDLILDPDILTRFAEELPRAGLVGEDRNAKILYLALTSRLFEQPVSVAVKGPSSGGKSHTVEVVLRFLPRSAYWERTTMSERALAYSNEDCRHRHLVMYEAAGMSDISSYLIRSLLTEGRICHETVEKTNQGLRSRTITKDGPTGLIVTTTAAKLHPENEARLLSLSVLDTPEQTRVILRAVAGGQDGTGAPDYARWRAFQDTLATGQRRVVVPFAERLADLIPPVAVRLRRDFRLLLTLVEAHALLHRERRRRDDQGRIVATVENDYAAVRELVADQFAEGVDATVKKETRETVEAVETIDKFEVSESEIARVLKLHKSAVSRRVADAIACGFLVNAETHKGLPARISLGDPLLDQAEILPQPDRLADRCSVAPLSAGYDDPPPPASDLCDAVDIPPFADRGTAPVWDDVAAPGAEDASGIDDVAGVGGCGEKPASKTKNAPVFDPDELLSRRYNLG
jgi:hypothetical protein